MQYNKQLAINGEKNSKVMIEDGGQHGIKVSDGMQQSLGLAWNSKMTISVKTGPIQKHLRRKKLVVKLVD